MGIHGWIHEHATSLPEGKELELIERSLRYTEKATGVRPVAYRAPSYDVSTSTIGILKKLGFLYDISLMADDRPYEIIEKKPTSIVELPVEWILDDATLLDPRGDNYTPPRELLRVFIDELDKAYEEGTVFLLIMHPKAIGHRSRIVILEELIAHIEGKENVWFATHQQAAAFVKQCCLDR
jgi:peptidoglycan/xylan/chitin deacetylase (PgdA/CDA1 family)